ncbi:hypothetical protein KHQ81_15735 (plasmid) [Mycoplasmatota bacterium]|nr:hypothetical protein KHQ81_15735 [Mycoplasmatota bacterium]
MKYGILTKSENQKWNIFMEGTKIKLTPKVFEKYKGHENLYSLKGESYKESTYDIFTTYDVISYYDEDENEQLMIEDISLWDEVNSIMNNYHQNPIIKLKIDGKEIIKENLIANFNKKIEQYLEQNLDYEEYMLFIDIAYKKQPTLKRWGVYNPNLKFFEFEQYSIRRYDYDSYSKSLATLLDQSDFLDILISYINNQEYCPYNNVKIEFLDRELSTTLEIKLYSYIDGLYSDVIESPKNFGISKDNPDIYSIVNAINEKGEEFTKNTYFLILSNDEYKNQVFKLLADIENDNMLPLDDLILEHGYEIIKNSNQRCLSL